MRSYSTAKSNNLTILDGLHIGAYYSSYGRHARASLASSWQRERLGRRVATSIALHGSACLANRSTEGVSEEELS